MSGGYILRMAVHAVFANTVCVIGREEDILGVEILSEDAYVIQHVLKIALVRGPECLNIQIIAEALPRARRMGARVIGHVNLPPLRPLGVYERFVWLEVPDNHPFGIRIRPMISPEVDRCISN